MLENKIKIAMLELSDQNRAVLEFYFSSVGQKLYSAVSEDKADAFIIDYDYPGAIETVAEKLKTNKPIVILSVKEQAQASTIWLEKPLTADALSNAATQLNEMISFEQADATVDAESEEVLDNAVEKLTSETETSVEDVADIFKKLDEANTQLDANKKIEARLAMAGTEALVSASDSINLPENPEENSLNETSHLEFAEILLDSEEKQAANVDSEGEVDALLESLILGEDNKEAENPDNNSVTKDDDEDLSLEEFSLHGDSLKEIEPETTVSDSVETSAESIDLLDESIVVEDTADPKVITEEKESLSIDENFTLHDDLNPSEEDVYADTLEVAYDDIKQDNNSKNEVPQIEIDEIKLESTTNEVADEENITAADDDNVDTHLDNLLKDVSLDSVDSFSSEEIPTDEIELEAQTDTTITENISTNKNLDDSKNLDLMNFGLESSGDSKEESLDKNIAEDVEDKNDTTLNNLLDEVSVDTASTINEQEQIDEIESFMTQTSTIEDDFNNLNEINDANEEVDNNEDFDLQSLLNEVREEATGESNNDDDSISEFKQTNAEKRWMQLCGNNSNIEVQKEVTKLSYNKKNHLLGVILEQVEAIKGSEQLYRLKYNDLIIVFDHSENSIYCNLPLTSDELSEICYTEIEHNKVKIHDLDYSEVKLYRDKIKDNPERAHSIEAFIWSTSLLTSRGRLPEKTNISQKVGLKVWPNMTRVELPPHAMHIAAVFSKHPGSLIEIAEWMGIEQRHVFAFYNGALTLGMLELDSSKIKKPSFNFGKKNSKDKSEQRSLFGRLLKRLKS